MSQETNPKLLNQRTWNMPEQIESHSMNHQQGASWLVSSSPISRSTHLVSHKHRNYSTGSSQDEMFSSNSMNKSEKDSISYSKKHSLIEAVYKSSGAIPSVNRVHLVSSSNTASSNRNEASDGNSNISQFIDPLSNCKLSYKTKKNPLFHQKTQQIDGKIFNYLIL